MRCFSRFLVVIDFYILKTFSRLTGEKKPYPVKIGLRLVAFHLAIEMYSNMVIELTLSSSKMLSENVPSLNWQ